MATQLKRNSSCGAAGWVVWPKFVGVVVAALGLCSCTPAWKMSVHNETGRDIRLTVIPDDPEIQEQIVELASAASVLMPFELGEIEKVRYQYDTADCVLARSEIVSRAYPVRQGSKQTRLDLTPCSLDSGPAQASLES